MNIFLNPSPGFHSLRRIEFIYVIIILFLESWPITLISRESFIIDLVIKCNTSKLFIIYNYLLTRKITMSLSIPY